MTSTADPQAVRELTLFATNDGDLYRQRATPIMVNLARKIAAGTYDGDKAVTLWRGMADAAAQAYTREHGDRAAKPSFGTFTPADRAAVALHLSGRYAEERDEIAADIKAGRRDKRGQQREAPPREFGVGVFDWSHDSNGNPTAHFDIPALRYRTGRRVQVGYGDKISGGVMDYLAARFPGWTFTISKTYGDRSTGRASLDIAATETR